MAYKALLFGTDDIFNELQPFYNAQVKRGNLDVVARVDNVSDPTADYKPSDFDIAIISSHEHFFERVKFLEAQGLPRNKIVDGRVFQVPNLNVPRLLAESVAYGVLEKDSFVANSNSIYPQRLSAGNLGVELGVKSYISGATIERDGVVSVGNFSAISWGITFEFALSQNHNYRTVTAYSLLGMDWTVPREFFPQFGKYRIEIGNDVWVGRGCFFKCGTPDKPLVIGDGAVIAADSVVVKNVPPYAIVGGNPAQIIKYRFTPDVIEALLRIKWWNWSLDKIHDNFKYFNDIDKFISIHDK